MTGARRDGLVQKKSLSQVFLHDDRPCRTLVRQLQSWGVSRVLEVGPGKGVLTQLLVEAGLQVTAVEKDERFAAYVRALAPKWRKAGSGEDLLTIEEGDFLEFDLNEWLEKNSEAAPGSQAVVGNIPYNISSPIVLKVLPLLQKMAGSIFLTQLEFAERLAARAGTKDYGSLTVLTNLYGAGNIIEKVSRTLFTPVPKVDSAVLTLTPLATPNSAEEIRAVEKISRVVFQQRRKKLSNSIAPFVQKDANMEKCPVDLGRRPETLTVKEFKDLAAFLRSKES